MSRVALFVAAVAAVSCNQPPRTIEESRTAVPPRPAEPGSSPVVSPSPRNDPSAAKRRPERRGNLELLEPDRPISASPFVVRGRARTFENHVTIRVRGEEGEIVLDTYATAAGDLGEMNPFARELFLPKHPGKRMTVELLDHSAKDGSVTERVARTVDFSVDASTVTLHFSKPSAAGDCQVTVPVRRTIPKTRSMIRAAVEALIAGPLPRERREQLAAPFPDGTAVRAVNFRNGTATVDFGPGMTNVGGSCRAMALRTMIEKTLLEIPGVERVEIRANGSAELALQP